ncbi:MAG: hypothetical protein KF813_05175 [Trueperaceae bacterium]|nr:hypothetical protein [Trueperaceae bacterium]
MRRSVQVAGLLIVLAAWQIAGAESRDNLHGGAPTLAQLLADFDAAYSPSAYAALALDDAGVVLARAEQSVLPSGSVTEAFSASWLGETELRFDTQVSLPLYSSIAPGNIALARISLAATEVELASERAARKAAYLSDLYMAALFADLLTRVESSLDALLSAYPRVAAGTTAAADAQHELRVALEHAAAAEDLRAYLVTQLDAIGSRFTRTLARRSPSSIDPKHLTAVVPDLIAALPPRAQPSDGACLETAPEAVLARARHHQALGATDLRSALDFSVLLTASAGLSSTGGVSGYAALSAELVLPPAAPVGGSGRVLVDAVGATQRFELRWPAYPSSRIVAGDPHQDLLLALDDVLQARRAAADALASAERSRDLAAARLDWFIADTSRAGHLPGSTSELTAFDDPFLQLQEVDLRARLVFAELTVGHALIDQALICGWTP